MVYGSYVATHCILLSTINNKQPWKDSFSCKTDYTTSAPLFGSGGIITATPSQAKSDKRSAYSILDTS
jgi:hypothetical protein